ncbi:MAG TPA: hypothetical protein ENK85_11195 [Saprospiraceae bacterium]|nr:hypothetical protein [Saprospiraceae bacterium]
MKYILSILIGLVLVTAVNAQSHADKVTEINDYTTRMALGDIQIGQTTKIIQSKYHKYESFKDLKQSNPSEYYANLKNTFDKTIDAMEQVMVSFRQKESFALYRAELQDEYAQLMQQYQAQGMSLEEATNQYYETVFFP